MNEKTHLFISEKAIEQSKIKISKKNKDILLNGSIIPDTDENEGAFKNHFYNPATRKNFRGERTTALTKFIEHYEKAKSGADIEELGRSIHFLEDLNTPVHIFYEDLFDSVYRLNQHIEFEKVCDKLVQNINFNSHIIEGYYTVNSLKTIGKACAMKASILFKELDEGKTKAEVIGERSINNAIGAVTGILIRFFGGCNNER